MKKKFIKVVLILALLIDLEAKEKEAKCGLEILWDFAESNNYDVAVAKINEEKALNEYKDYRKKRIPSISTSTSYSFEPFVSTESESFFEIKNSLIFSEDLNNGTEIVINPTVLFSKEYSTEAVCKNATENLDSFELEIGLYQNLYPYWLQGYKTNPDKKNGLLKTQEAQCLRKIEVLKCKEQITELYIEYRSVCRNLDCLQNYLIYLREKKKALEELKDNGNISSMDLWKLDDEIQDYYQDCLDLDNTRENLKNKIFDKSGFSFGDKDIFENINFFDELPLEFSNEDINPTAEYFTIQRNLLLNDYVVAKQNNAPKAKFGINIPLYEKKTDILSDFITSSKKLDVNLIIDFSPEIFQNKKTKQYYLEWNKLYERKLETIKENLIREKKFYSEREKEIEKACIFYENLFFEKNQILEAIEILFKQKNCNFIELAEAKLSQLTVSNRLKNLQDERWYYFWMKQIRNYEY